MSRTVPEVEGEVRVGGHEHDSEEAVFLEEADHPCLGRVDKRIL